MNWTRERLKTNGKIAFKKNYWACVAVAVIMGIITGLSSISGGRTGSGASQNSLYGNDGFSTSLLLLFQCARWFAAHWNTNSILHQ